jgi:hypothetical protein
LDLRGMDERLAVAEQALIAFLREGYTQSSLQSTIYWDRSMDIDLQSNSPNKYLDR